MFRITTAAAVSILSITVVASAQEENEIAMDEVPQAARDAAMTHSMGVTFDSVQIDDDQGTETYEFSGEMADGMMLEVDVLADGTVEEIEEEIAMNAVPEAVSATLEREAPGLEPTFIERSTRRDQVVYEFEGMIDGREMDVEIAEDGSLLVMNEDAAQ